jgi:hypothetical protein
LVVVDEGAGDLPTAAVDRRAGGLARQRFNHVVVVPAALVGTALELRRVEVGTQVGEPSQALPAAVVGAGIAVLARQRLLRHQPGDDHDPALHLALGEADYPAQHRGPHVQLDLL